MKVINLIKTPLNKYNDSYYFNNNLKQADLNQMAMNYYTYKLVINLNNFLFFILAITINPQQ